MRSRESRRRAKRVAARMAKPRLLVSGDAAEVLQALRADADAYGIEIVPDPAAATPDSAGEPPSGAEPPTIAVVAVWIGQNQSALQRGLRALELVEPRLAPDTVRLVVTLAGAARKMPRKVLEALSAELPYQVESAVYADESRRPWRTARLRSGRTVLTALGVRVFRVAPPSGGTSSLN